MPQATLALICCNQKINGKKCCAIAEAEAMHAYMRQVLLEKQDRIPAGRRIKAVKTGCLGECATGPNILISPDNVWYTYHSKADIDEIVESHLIAGKSVERLRKLNV